MASTEVARPCPLPADAVISEFQASNGSTYRDDDGDFSDWLEIYNPCTPLVDLGGWYLTDDPDVPTKWAFPAGVTLGRGSHLIVFASGKNRTVTGARLHTNFKLDASGEYLALIEPDGVTVAHAFQPIYPPQYPELSYGLPQQATTLLSAGHPTAYHVPSSSDQGLGTEWTAVAFDDATWSSGPAGIGMVGPTAEGFDVVYYKANVPVNDLAAAEAVIDDPATQTSVVSATAPLVNFRNTGGSGRYPEDAPFPGTVMGTDVNDFVVVVTGVVVIPTAGPWTFGVNSDDGFGLTLWREPLVFESSFPTPRGPADTLAVFPIPQAGVYQLRLSFFERGGGSGLELFAAPGSHASFDPQHFRLVGDVANGGLGSTFLSAFVETDVTPVMRGVNASLWARSGFQVPDPSSLGVLLLDASYEDGFVAYLDGVEVARRNAPPAVAWDSAAASDRPIDAALLAERIDLTESIGLLQAGANVLALHGLNDDPMDPDFLALPVLTAVQDLTDTSTGVFFTTPTPGVSNDTGYPGVSVSPEFSHTSTTFTSPFLLTLTAPAPGGQIIYTTDGTDPTPTDAVVYGGPLSIDTSTEVRARVLGPGMAPGPIVTRMYVRLGTDVLGFSSNLPIVIVDTIGPAIAEEWLTPVLASFIDVDPVSGRAAAGAVPQFVGRGGLRIRGSSSRSFPKKQYLFETWDEGGNDLEVSLLGFPTESDWILYAPYSEKSLMQNDLAYRWGNDMGRYAVRTRFCEMFLRTGPGEVTSQDYVGVYVLMERIKRDPNRVNIEELGPEQNSEPAITGGYIVKVDRLDPGDVGFLTSHGFRLAYVDPKEEEITPQQSQYIRGYLDQFEAALYGPNAADPVLGYAAYIDVGSFIDHHILVEMTKNIDGYRLSTFFHKDRNGKLVSGPVWDYNLSLGNADYLEGWLATGWYYPQLSASDYPWWPLLFTDPEFQLRYADRWFELRRGPFATEDLVADIDGYAALLEEAQARNFLRWPILGVEVWPNYFVGPTYQSEVDWMRQFLVDRVTWMDAQFPAPPALDPAPGPVLFGAAVTMSAASGTIYYTLDGSDPRLPGGAISASAQVYAGPLAVTVPVHVRTRSLSGATWSAQNEGAYEPVPPAVVNEVLPVNATVIVDEAGDLDPWIELYNPHQGRMDWSALFLSDDPLSPFKWPFPAGTSTCGLEHVLVWADGETGEGPLHAGFVLSPGGGEVGLYDAGGTLLSTLTYPPLGPNVSFGRMPDGGPDLVSFLYPTPAAVNTGSATVLFVNEYNGVSPSRFLGNNASDPFFGRVLGNGGDWLELVVVADHLDVRGWQVVVRDSVGLPEETTQTLTFTSDPLLADLRSGTILTVGESPATDPSYTPASGDWWIHLRAGTAGDGQYVSALDFTVSNQSTQITLRDASGNTVFGPAGEGIFPASGVGNDEVFKLEGDPSATVTAFSAFKDGTSSTFGAPNLWGGGTTAQDFGPLRAVVSASCAVDGDCDDGNPCTDDLCALSTCSNPANAAPCNDQDACTGNDVCANRVCRGQAVTGCCDTDCDCDDGSACTTDQCVLNQCTHATTAPCGISGAVRYYRSGDTEPSALAVGGVGIDVDLDAVADATTGLDGTYHLPAATGNLSVEPLDLYGDPRAAFHNDAITSFDAAMIAQAAVLTRTLSQNQSIAADVTGNGQVTAFDAARVAQFAILLVDHLDVAVASGSDWRFFRCDVYQSPSNQSCGAPIYEHTPLSSPATDDFYAILYGDVSGSWAPLENRIAPLTAGGASDDEAAAIARDRETARRLRARPSEIAPLATQDRPARLTLEGARGAMRAGETRTVRLGIQDADGIEALDLDLDYDPAKLEIAAVEPDGLAAEWSLARNETGGSLRLALYGPLAVKGSGPILTLRVTARAALPSGTGLRVGGVANEGEIPLLPPTRGPS